MTGTRTAVAAIVSMALLAAACSDDSSSTTTAAPTSTTTTTAAPTTTTTVPTVQVIDEVFLTEQVNKSWDETLPGAVMTVVFDPSGAAVHAGVGSEPSGATPTPERTYRVGSISKLITAVAVLTLVDDGSVDLDAPLSEYVTRVDLDDRITVRHTMQHQSGILDYTEIQNFDGLLFDDTSREWTPEEIVAIAGTETLDFDPGAAVQYSNTNYILLGLLIEEVTGQAYHEALRERVLDPLGMDNTYLEWFEDGTPAFGGYTETLGTVRPIDFDYTAIATIAWASGAMVSTGPDLHVLMTALFAGEIISPELVAQMTENPEYGLGIYAPELAAETPIWGHDGRTYGSGTWLIHAPETGMTVFTVSNSNHLFVTPATEDVVAAMSVPGIELNPTE